MYNVYEKKKKKKKKRQKRLTLAAGTVRAPFALLRTLLFGLAIDPIVLVAAVLHDTSDCRCFIEQFSGTVIYLSWRTAIDVPAFGPLARPLPSDVASEDLLKRGIRY